MMKNFWRYFLIILLVSVITHAETFKVGLINDFKVDGDITEWPQNSLKLNVLTYDGQRDNDEDFWVKMQIGWNLEGLLLAYTIIDDISIESKKTSDLWRHDSIEMFFTPKPGMKKFYQLIMATGNDPKFGNPRFSLYDKYSIGPKLKSLEQKAAVVKDGTKTTVELLIPWQKLGFGGYKTGQMGIQAYVNDCDSANGKRTSARWFPLGSTHQNTNNMHTIIFDTKSSPEVNISANITYPGFKYTRISVLAAKSFAGRKITLKPFINDKLELTANAHSAGLQLKQMLPSASAEIDKATLKIGRKKIALSPPDLDKERQKLFKSAPLNKGYIIQGNALPEVDFLNPGWIEYACGPYTVETTFYNSKFEKVTTAKEPGRYGAVIVIKSKDQDYERKEFKTYFKPAGEISWRSWRKVKWTTGTGPWPDEYGISQKVVANQKENLGNFSKWGFADELAEKESGAILLSAMYEMPEDAPDVDRFDCWNVNSNWWFKLKTKINDPSADTEYHVDLPEDYAADRNVKWPLVLFLHGAGERGDDLEKVRKHGPAKLARLGRNFPFILVSPQCPKNEWWSSARVLTLLDKLEKKYRVDKNRIYLTGLSMGGYGSWLTAMAAPDRFAAVAPVCGGGDPKDAAIIKGVPIWAFHGDADNVVLPENSINMVNALKKLNAPVALTIYPGVGHNSWDKAYNDERLYEWLLKNNLGKTPVKPPEAGK